MKRNQFLVRKIEMNQNVRLLLGMQWGKVIVVRYRRANLIVGWLHLVCLG